MAKVSRTQPSRPRVFSLGGEQAEADPLLSDGFFNSGQYGAISDFEDPRAFLIGRTGAGKSALLQQLEIDRRGHVIRINPEDLSLPYIAELNVVRFLAESNVHLDPLFIALWKHILLIEIIKNRYKIETPAAKTNFLAMLKEKISRDRSKLAALEYLEEFQSKFWCETDERVREITNGFETRLQDEMGGKAQLESVMSGEARRSKESSNHHETRSEYAERFQRVVNATQLPRLNKMLSVLDEDILDSPQNRTYVVIDDLDRDWVDEGVANALIRCLFRAVVDLKRVRNLKVIVALRSNIFDTLDFGAKTGGQEEKFRSLTLPVRWSSADLEQLLSERARAASSHLPAPTVSNVRDLLPSTNKTRGSALDFITRRTLLRPRDAISYFNECYALNGGKSKLTWDIIHAAEGEYSRKRFLALRDEWKPNYPGIDQVLRKFTQAPILITREQLGEIFQEIALLISDERFVGAQWIGDLVEPLWAATPLSSWVDCHHPLLERLYAVGFLGCRIQGKSEVTFSSVDPYFATTRSNVQGCDAFFVHPAFRPALDIQRSDDRET